MINRLKLGVFRKIKVRNDNLFQNAVKDVSNGAMSHWLQASTRRERHLFLTQGAAGLAAITLLNPSFYKIFYYGRPSLALLSLIATSVILIVFNYIFFLFLFYIYALSPQLLLNRQAGSNPIKVSFSPVAKVINSFQDSAIGALPTMIDPLEVYQVAETKQFFIKEFLVSKNSLKRVVAISLCAAFFIILGGLDNAIILTITQVALVFIALLLIEMISAWYRYQSQLAQLRQIQSDYSIASTERTVSRPWGEYVVYVVSTNNEDGRLLHSTKEMAVLDTLSGHGGSARLKSGLMLDNKNSPQNSLFNEFGLALYLLLANSYNALQVINNTSSDLLPQAIYPQLHKDIDYLIYIIEQLVPECMQKLESAYSGEYTVGVHTFLKKEYKKLCEEVLIHDGKVAKIRQYYEQVSQNGLLNSLKTAFDRPPEPRPIESPPINNNLAAIPNKVIHRSIKEKIIPELQNLLIHADPSLKSEIQKSIDNFEAFYNKQLLAQQAAIDLFEHKDSGSSINNQDVDSTKSIQNRLSELDFYLKELDRQW